MENIFRATVANWLTLVLVILAAHCIFRTVRFFLQKGKMAGSRKPRAPLLMIPFRLGTYTVTFGAMGVLAYSAYTGTSSAEHHLTGFDLMTHATAAPVYIASLVFTVLLWAHRNRFQEADWRRLRYPFSSKMGPRNSYAVLLRKIFFWIMVALSIPAAVSVIISLFPLLTPERQDSLLFWHRYTTLGVFLSGIIFVYLSMVAREPAQ